MTERAETNRMEFRALKASGTATSQVGGGRPSGGGLANTVDRRPRGSHGRCAEHPGSTSRVHSGTRGRVYTGAWNALSSPGLLLPTGPPGIF